MKLYIKNMVCDRCIMVVRTELTALGLHPVTVALGDVELAEDSLTPATQNDIKQRMNELGFEVLEDRVSKIVEGIKTALIKLIHQHDDDKAMKHSEYLAKHLHMDYAYLSKVFSDTEQTTIEQYIIQQKTERVKELLEYKELTLSEIAWQMGYSSPGALSSQFKKVTGMSPSIYKTKAKGDRKTLDRVGG